MSKFINVIINPVGDACNLKCTYCYTLRRQEARGELPLNQLFKLFKTISNLEGIEHICYTWHGGEPLLMGIDYFRKAIDYQAEVSESVIYENIIQTNGLLINKDWIELFIKEHISVGISIDGIDYKSNRNRFASEEQFQQLLENLKLLKSLNFTPSLFFTLTKSNIEQLDEIFAFIEAYQPSCYMFNPVMDDNFAISSEVWCNILLQMHDFSNRTQIMNALTYHIDNGIHGKVPGLCLVNGMCNKFISVNNKADVFASCINHSPDFYLSSIDLDSLKTDIQHYVNTPINMNAPSIYQKLGKNYAYRYFQGNGCEKCRSSKNNAEFTNGIAQYIIIVGKGQDARKCSITTHLASRPTI